MSSMKQRIGDRVIDWIDVLLIGGLFLFVAYGLGVTLYAVVEMIFFN
jgi:hypothetical protein